MALALAMVLSLAACGGKDSAPATSAPTAAAEIAAPKDSINVCIASEPDTIDPALNSSVDGATMISHLFAGIARWGRDSEGKAVLEPDCAEELTEGVLNEDGTVTYTYTLRDGLKWSDGKPLTAGDFVFAWNRAASEALGADYTEVMDQATALLEVSSGTADAAVIDSLMAAAMVGEGTSYADLTYTVGLNSEEYGVGFRKGSDLAAALNDFFKAAYADGSMQTMAEAYGVQAALIAQ